jgi:hypothetical protein
VTARSHTRSRRRQKARQRDRERRRPPVRSTETNADRMRRRYLRRRRELLDVLSADGPPASDWEAWALRQVHRFDPSTENRTRAARRLPQQRGNP